MANIIICADGTWNRPEQSDSDHPTNVLKLARAIRPEQGNTKQHVFYDWGIGSYHDGMRAGITGHGLEKNVMDGYRYIVQNYNPGDKIFLFGFSRGAYTVRSLSGLINNAGILKRTDAREIEDAWKLYKTRLGTTKPSGQRAIDFRNKYSVPDSQSVHFVGVWDTVGALGIPFTFFGLLDDKDQFFDVELGSNVNVARHALAVDEKREDFLPTLWQQKDNLDLKQVWFSGVHSDVGGSYEPDDNDELASDIPLKWMLDEAEHSGLLIEPHIRDALTSNPLAELNKSRIRYYRLRPKEHRDLIIRDKPSKIHPSVKERYEQDSKYRPKKLEALVKKVGWDQIEVGV